MTEHHLSRGNWIKGLKLLNYLTFQPFDFERT